MTTHDTPTPANQAPSNQTPSSQTVAVIGLGIMGGPMAGNLVKAGYDVRATHRDLGRE